MGEILFFNFQAFHPLRFTNASTFVSQGLRDLAAGLIRTPLPPLTTFLDDPLRVLRCVRFASRFDYELHPSIVRCLTGLEIGPRSEEPERLVAESDPRLGAGAGGEGGHDLERGQEEVRLALVNKVSRERFGIEVDKMMKGGPRTISWCRCGMPRASQSC